MISKRKLLEWNPSGITGHFTYSNLIGAFQSMWVSPVFATITMVCIAVFNPISLAIAWPFLVSWFLSPAVVWLISLPIAPRIAKFSSAQYRFLFNISRKTWRFFEDFVTAADNWLPPDNYQEHPNPVVAHRTSPTNIGLSLLANLTAYDFGYILTGELLERTSNTFSTMKRLERYQGHFMNWYDTETLVPLQPLYISSVDSGNLAGHLLTLKPGLLALPDQPIVGPRLLEGINDTFQVLLSYTEKYTPSSVTNFKKDLELYLDSPLQRIDEVWECLKKMTDSSAVMVGSFNQGFEGSVLEWAKSLHEQCKRALEEILFLVPWVALLPKGNFFITDLGLDQIPTLYQLAHYDKTVITYLNESSAKEKIAVNEDLLNSIISSVQESSRRAHERINQIEDLANQANEFSTMEYEFLYDRSRHLQSIGYNIDDRRRDSSYYDLLASEARLSTFIAIAQGQIPQESWFALGRLLTVTEGEPTLLSWSGSMFEYLMPLIVMPMYENTILHQTCKGAVLRQIEYGKQRGVPW
jgi:hypothetical protein